MPAEWPDFKVSQTGGVKPMSIQGRFAEPRARLSPDFTDADRAWRKQWLKDQILAHDEPRFVPQHYYGTKNVIRRFYRAPFDALERAMVPKFGEETAKSIRWCMSKTLMAYGFVVLTFYWFKYNSNDWTRVGGWKLKTYGGVCLPCHADYPKKVQDLKPSDYDPYGFKDRRTHLNI